MLTCRASCKMSFWISELMDCWTGSWTAGHFWLQELDDGAKRNFQPRGPVLQFVANFINGFFEQMNIEQHLQFFFGTRQQIGFADDFEIRIEKNRADPAIPKTGPGLKLREPLLV